MPVTDGRTDTAGSANHYIVPATAATVHWGYLSRSLQPVLAVESGDFVTIETLTHHAYDEHARMIAGDPDAESVFLWTKHTKNVTGAVPARWMARSTGAAPARGSGYISAPAPSLCVMPNRATCSKRGFSM